MTYTSSGNVELDRLEKYGAYGAVAEPPPPPYDESAREKRLAKLDRVSRPKMARAGRPGLAQPAPADAEGKSTRKWRRNGLKTLNQRPEMVASRKPRSHKMWYTGARLTVRSD